MAPYYTINLKVDPAFAEQVDRAGLRAAARAALAQQQALGPGALSLMISDDARLHALNLEFLGEDHPTDVLSFPSGETAGGETGSDAGVRYYGDIAISLPAARAQARAAKHSLLAEMQLLVVHGVLHLLGHDHARAKDTAEMWQVQADILAALTQPQAHRARGAKGV
jgi:probable rRNA maturation factor